MTALLATTAAAVYGCADFLGGLASREESPFAVSALSQLLGLIVLVVLIPFLGQGMPDAADLVWGGAAGLFGGWGVVALYAALGTGRMSVVAPTTAALAAAGPAVYDVLTGGSLGSITVAGIALAIAAIVIVSMTSEDEGEGSSSSAFALSIAAGLAFAAFFILLSFTSPDAGLWPLLGARAVSVPVLTVLALAKGGLRVSRGSLPTIAAAGVLDMVANVFVLLAIQRGPLAVASVLASLYPVATVLLARIVLHERLRGLQRVGVAMALLAVVLASMP
jgi:drug/metabolite transporter (DMT)-like permease